MCMLDIVKVVYKTVQGIEWAEREGAVSILLSYIRLYNRLFRRERSAMWARLAVYIYFATVYFSSGSCAAAQ